MFALDKVFQESQILDGASPSRVPLEPCSEGPAHNDSLFYTWLVFLS
jgi:hypothetical protein